MPTYTYRCNNCSHQFDIRQRMSDESLTNCLECSSEQSLRKVLNSVGIVFKGSGFYVTDNRGKKKESASASNGKGSDNGGSAIADSKTAVNEKGSSKAEKKPVASSKTDKKTPA
ncbi:MAG: FmdB family transcriptional regulator [Chloroflexi bacterium]|nr:FmdB family transcriptional regulator [Chloroflexota bacterium]